MSFINDIISNPLMYILRIPVLLLALSLHEMSHGYIASKLGDPTARNLGRLTLNPLKHLDLIGTICMFLFGFGWAKPVPVNTRYFKKPKRDMALTALAGPVSNLLLSFIGVILYEITYKIYASSDALKGTFEYNVFNILLLFFAIFYTLNASLAIFNLIPVPPLDGSRIFLTFLPVNAYFTVMKYERYIMLGLMVLLWFGLLGKPLSFLVSHLIDGMFFIVELIPVFR